MQTTIKEQAQELIRVNLNQFLKVHQEMKLWKNID
jgi:hypothetical protein